MATMLSRVLAMSARVETSYASATPTDATFASGQLLFRQTSPFQLDTARVDTAELKSTFTKSGDASGRQLYRMTPGMVLQGHDANIPAYRLDPIFRMCGMQATTPTAGTRKYVFRTTGLESGVIDFQQNDTGSSGILYGLKGVFGTMTMSGSAGQLIEMNPTLTGIINTQPATAGTVTGSYPANIVQTMKSEALSITDSGGPFTTAKFKSFSLDFGWTVSEDTDANAADALGGLALTARVPTLSLVVGMDSARYATWAADLKNNVQHTITWTHGSGTGKRIKFSITGILNDIPQGDDVGLRTNTLTYGLTSATAEGELSIEVF
jgi:hypothetical protein